MRVITSARPRAYMYASNDVVLCSECRTPITRYAWADGHHLGFALPCGHHANPSIAPLTPEEIAVALLMAEGA